MENINIKELNERIQQESSFVDILSLEMGKVDCGTEASGGESDELPFWLMDISFLKVFLVLPRLWLSALCPRP